jgi:hypothetical protein
VVTESGDPDITVLGNGVSISDGDTSASPTDGTDFGIVLQGGAPAVHTYTVRNDGTSMLTFGPPSDVPVGFTWLGGQGNVAPGESSTFSIQLDTRVSGRKTGEYVFSNNDPDEHPFSFSIRGTVSSSKVPDITLLGNGKLILDEDNSPHTEDGTDFGVVQRGSPPVSHVFTVRNDGSDMLTTLVPIAVPTGFKVTEGLSFFLMPGASDTFTVQLGTSTAGTKTGDVILVSNDGDESPFTFRITGTVTP